MYVTGFLPQAYLEVVSRLSMNQVPPPVWNFGVSIDFKGTPRKSSAERHYLVWSTS
jgi:hypothetical protein